MGFREPRRARELDCAFGYQRSHEKVKQRCRAFVDPLQIVQDQGDRTAGRQPLQQRRGRTEEPVAIAAVDSACGEQRGCLGHDSIIDAVSRNPAQGVQPQSIGANHLGFEAAAANHEPACDDRTRGESAEQRCLPDAGLAGEEQQHAAACAGQSLVDSSAFDRPSNQNLSDHAAGLLHGGLLQARLP
jgi:hypothetical protein